MTDQTDQNQEQQEEKPVRAPRPRRIELKKTVDAGQVRQSFSHGRTKSVTVEVKKKRTFAPGAGGRMSEVKAELVAEAPSDAPVEPVAAETEEPSTEAFAKAATLRTLTDEEKAARARALKGALVKDQSDQEQGFDIADEDARLEEERLQSEQAEQLRLDEESQRRTEEEERRRAEVGVIRRAEEQADRFEAREQERLDPTEEAATAAKKIGADGEAAEGEEGEEGEGARPRRPGRAEPRRPVARRGEPRRRIGKLTISQALDDGDERTRSLASVRRARERERRANLAAVELPTKIIREVVIPETITVQELSNRMAERGSEVIKSMMKMGVVATVNQAIEADIAELIVTEFGHIPKRVSEADVEIGLKAEPDRPEALQPRAPVVTVMGHVDHGKTSLLDALRETNVAAGEAGGITQHIGAYQVELSSGEKITFIDTPGHQAFTAMRARGASITDIVVLVVAADDGIMPQTVEAIDHAKAAGVPIIVAINKMDRPDANPDRVRNDLLQHELVVEGLGGDILTIEVSATQKTNLDKLEEAILLQAELLEIKANPDRACDGVVVEAKLDRGRGAMTTVLVKGGTLRTGDILVAGSEWGRARSLLDGAGNRVDEAGPSMPVEVLGLSGVPMAGDEVTVVENEARAREVSEFRHRRQRATTAETFSRGTLEQMFSQIESGTASELPIVIKGDVQGSVEALDASLRGLNTDEVAVRILHAGVGGISESDISLAAASNAFVIAFNVRANPQSRGLAKLEGVDIRYYSIIYEVTDHVKALLSGMLKPTSREQVLGNAQIQEVFSITKVGKVAGCRVTDGLVRRGAHVRLVRNDIVVHEGNLTSLKRFKDEVREVREGMECGMAFEKYQDIKMGDVIECFEVEEVARTL